MTHKYRGYIIDTSNYDIKVRNTLGQDLFPFSFGFNSTQEAEQATDVIADINQRTLAQFNEAIRPKPSLGSLRDHPALHAHIDAVIDITTDEMNTLAERMKQRCQEIATAAYQDGYSAGLQERGVEKEDCRIIPIDHEVPE